MSSGLLGGPPPATGLARWIPAVGWVRGYGGSDFRADAVAGVTLAAYILPKAIGDASLARLPPEAGLYSCMFAGLVFWGLCSSRRTAVAATSAISLLMGTSLGSIAGGDTSRFVALAAATALLVGVLAFLAWLARAGSLVNFVSETVLTGFKAGAGLTLITTQVPKLLGVSGVQGNFRESSRHLLRHLGETNWASVAVGLAALAVLVFGKFFMKNKPVALFVVIGGVVAAGVFGLGSRGVKLLGEVPQGLPSIGFPIVHWDEIDELLPLAMACCLLGAVETSAIGRMFASKHGGRFDATQEFLALAGANTASALGGGFPVSGGMSQSLVNESAGARTPVSGLLAALVIVAVAMFLSGLLRDLPQPVLAAIVLVAGAGLISVAAFRRLWHADKSEFFIAIVAVAAVLESGLLRGVLIGAVISLVLLIRRASRPHVAFLGRIPGARRYSDLERHPDNQEVPGVVIFRPEISLLYFNADHVRDAVLSRVRTATPKPRAVVCDLSNSPHVDLAGAEMLKELEAALGDAGLGLDVVEARSSARDRLRRVGLQSRIDRFTSVADAVEALQRESPGPGG
jgi:high affinity sulfate transporter 1